MDWVGRANVWDNGREGNFWSNYGGTDPNLEGIGDTSYVIDANNTDNYPLMNVIPEFPSFLILPLFFTATLLAVAIYRSARLKKVSATRRRNLENAQRIHRKLNAHLDLA